MSDNIEDTMAGVDVKDIPAPYKSLDDVVSNIDVKDIPAPTKTLTEKAGDVFQSVVGYRPSEVPQAVGNTIDEIGGVPGFTDAALGVAKDVISAPFKVAAPIFDTSDRLMGTTLGYSLDGYQSMFGFNSSIDKATLADMEQQRQNSLENGIKELPQPRLLAMSLFKDIFSDPAKKAMQATGKRMQELNIPGGELVEGMAPSTGLAAGLAGSWYLDPIALAKFGKLTETGELLQKEGLLSDGVAQQVAKGERGAFGLQFSGPFLESKYVPLIPQKTASQLLDKVQGIAMDLEASKAGQWARKYTTLPSLPGVARSGQNLAYAENFIQSESKLYQDMWKDKLSSINLGEANFDYSNPEHRLDFMRYIENPTQYKPKFGSPEVYEGMYNGMSKDLNLAVQDARMNGINIDEKFDTMGPRQLGESERYVPRGTMPDKKQQYMVRGFVNDAGEAQKAVEELGLGNSKGTSTGYSETRSWSNRDQMNKLIESKTGIPDFFHDDVVKAYADKIAEVRRATEMKKFVDGIASTSAASRYDWLVIRNAALNRVNLAREAGVVPDFIDKKLSRVALDQLTPIGDVVGSKMNQVMSTAEDYKNYSKLLLPKSDADFVKGLFMSPGPEGVKAFMNSYMRAWKGSTFFNPGFIGRRAFDNYSRAMMVGLSPAEIARGQAAYVFNKGEWTKYYDEFNSFEQKMGLASDVNASNTAKIVVPKDVLEQENAQDRVLNSMHEMAQRGNIKKWYDLSSKLDSFAQNPAFRFASSANNKIENSIKFGYYAKLRDEGWSVGAALKEADNAFISYNLMRNSVKSNQAYIPFLNYMIKNAETTVSLFGKSTKGAVMFAPGGALERAVEDWSGWDPYQVKKYKEMFGDYYSDQILGPILPGKEQMDSEKDYVKRLLNTWLNKDGSMTGFQLWAKLPSNYNALMMLDPRKSNEMAGPAIKMGLALLGIDPITGEQITGANGETIGGTQRLSAMIDQAGDGFIPSKVINASRELLRQKWPDVENKLVNFGLDKNLVNTILGDDSDEMRKKMQKALLSVKMVYMGNATKVDTDILVRQMALMKKANSDISQILSYTAKSGSDKQTDQAINRAINVMTKTADKMIRFIDIKDDYDRRLEKLGGVPEPEIEFKDEINDIMDPHRDDGSEPGPGQVQKESIDGAMNEMMQSHDWLKEGQRSPASTNVQPSPTVNPDTDTMSLLQLRQMNTGVPITREPLEKTPVAPMWKQRRDEIIKKYNIDESNPKEKKFLDDFIRQEYNIEMPSLPEIQQGNSRNRMPAGK